MFRQPNRQSVSSKGFTLIELVAVIVILGILAVVAAPKYIDLTQDAKAATMQAVGGAMKSSLQLINSRALIEQQNTGVGLVNINGTDVPLYNGFPSVRGRDSFVDINNQVLSWLDIDAVDRNTARADNTAATFFTDKSTRSNQIYIFFSEDYGKKGVNFKCQIRYENPVTATPVKPIVKIETDDC